MTKQVFINLLLCIFSLSFCVAQKQDSLKTINLQAISISDSSSEYKELDSKESGSYINKYTIEKIQTNNVGDIAKYISGVTVKDYGGIGGLKSISVRGLGTQHTAVIYDGVSISDYQTGQIDLSKFSSNNIKEVSLSNGQGFALLQSARALSSANVFNIETTSPIFHKTEKINSSIKTSYGSFNYFNLGVNTAFKINNNWSSVLDFDIVNTDGKYPFTLKYGNDINDSTSKETRRNSDYFGFRGEWNTFGKFKKSDIKLKAYYFHSERGLPGSTIFYNPNAYSQRLWDNTIFGQSIFTYNFSKKLRYRNHAKVSSSYTHYFDSKVFNTLGYQSDKYTQNEYFINNVISYNLIKNTHISLTNDIIFSDLNSSSKYIHSPERFSALSAASILFDNSKLLLNANILHTYTNDNVSLGKTITNKNHFSPFISVGYTWSDAFTISAFYKDIFRMPTFNDLYFNRVSEPNLKPEKARQFNLHTAFAKYIGKYQSTLLTLSIDAYHNTVIDKIVAMPSKNLFIWSIINYGEVNINGIDFQSSIKTFLPFHIDLMIKGNYSYQRTVDASDRNAVTYGHQIPYTPRHSGSMLLSIEHPILDFSYNITFVGERFALGENIDRNRLKPYQDHSISISKTFEYKNQTINIGLSSLNIFNQQYEVVRYYPMPLRQFRINLKLNLK